MQACFRRQADILKRFHQIAENRALRTARGMGFLFQLFFKISFSAGPHHNHLQVSIIVNRGDLIIGPQHILIAQIADRQLLWEVTDGHRRDDFLRI